MKVIDNGFNVSSGVELKFKITFNRHFMICNYNQLRRYQ
jgi:hypothetical protein